MKNKIVIIFALLALVSCSGRPKNAAESDREAKLYPDFAGATFPVNIAAPTFIVDEVGEEYYTEIGLVGEEPRIISSSTKAEVCPSLGDWHHMLADAKGKDIYVRCFVKSKDGKWTQMKDVVCHVGEEPIDGWLVYRLLYPGYELWNEMGIYQRDLSSYDQTAVMENKDIDTQCVNCHSFAAGAPETMMIHVRGPQGGTLLRKDGKTTKVNPKCPALDNGATYPAWHPSGRYIAFSANNIQQFFHAKGTKTIEVSDLSADMTVYDVEKGVAVTAPQLSGKEWMETFPTWGPDGKTLYFCRAKGYNEGEPLDSIHYDLCRVTFNPSDATFGEPEVVFAAVEKSKSVSFPRVSPDGRWLLFTLSDYGNFSIWHPESDLWLMDLKSGNARPGQEVNSDDVDSYHSWSSNGRWIVFSSKRMDGLWARPYIASFDPSSGKFGVPFPLPQESPLFYDDFMKTFNIPELVKAPVTDTAAFSDAVKGN